MMIYVHIPFCRRKCVYCAFYSVPNADSCGLSGYVGLLCKEISDRKKEFHDVKVKTLYFGGGTPSLLQLDDLRMIVDSLRENYDLSDLREFTFEANPEQLAREYLDGLKRLGVDRLSIGVQSFDDADLKLLNRRHTAKQAVDAVKNARNAGFGNVSVDLIYGLPGSRSWKKNLEQVESLDIQHLSCYSLTLEEGTALDKLVAKGKIAMPCDEEVLGQYGFLLKWAENHGFRQYEISNFCKDGFRSRHNSGYWNGTHYMGFGAAAHSFDGRRRRWNFSDVEKYGNALKDGLQCYEYEVLTKEMRFNEYMMTALRTTEGVRYGVLSKNFPEFVPELLERAKAFVGRGLLEFTSGGFRATAEGLLFADGMASELFA